MCKCDNTNKYVSAVFILCFFFIYHKVRNEFGEEMKINISKSANGNTKSDIKNFVVQKKINRKSYTKSDIKKLRGSKNLTTKLHEVTQSQT
jgi:hypothetical protein